MIVCQDDGGGVVLEGVLNEFAGVYGNYHLHFGLIPILPAL